MSEIGAAPAGDEQIIFSLDEQFLRGLPRTTVHEYERCRSKRKLVFRTFGRTWDIIPGTDDGDFAEIRIRARGRDAKRGLYVRRSDLDGRRIWIRLFLRVGV